MLARHDVMTDKPTEPPGVLGRRGAFLSGIIGAF